MPISLGFGEWGCPCHCNSGEKKTETLSSAPARFYNTAAGQGIPDPDRGAHWARDTVCSSCVLFLVSLVIDLCCLTAVEERW